MTTAKPNASWFVAVLIDCDSFQVTVGPKTFICKVGVPDFTPPELQGQRLDQFARTPSIVRNQNSGVVYVTDNTPGVVDVRNRRSDIQGSVYQKRKVRPGKGGFSASGGI